MFGHRKTDAERDAAAQAALAGYRARFDAAQALADGGEKRAALVRLNRDIERKSVKTRQTRRRVLFRKYGFVIAMPPAIATATALLVSVIGYPAFLFSMTLAWVGGVRALNRAERPPEQIAYRVYQAKKETAAAPFRALQAEIKAVADVLPVPPKRKPFAAIKALFNRKASRAQKKSPANKPPAGPQNSL